ncbi:MAG: VCBS repeat-containing protein, partial [Planctomycetes bacterium]|nr:VCBS repeat-containing protein [Planctomycetota bacterium]
MSATESLFLRALWILLLASNALAQQAYEISRRYRNAEAVLAVGDQNGDGHPDFLVGDPQAGLVELVSGRSFTPLASWREPTPNSRFGTRLAARDVNGDGVLDIAVTAPADQGGLGAFYLINGTTRAIVGRGVGNGGTFGWSVCFADLYPFPPDGVPEVLIGAPTRSSGTSLQVGEVTVYEVKNFIVRTVGTSTGRAAFDRYGESIASNGNLGPNPGEDVVITARGGPSSLTPCSGGYFVVRDSISTTRVNGPPRVCFGSSILIDDVDGDNAKEIVIGCGFT